MTGLWTNIFASGIVVASIGFASLSRPLIGKTRQASHLTQPSSAAIKSVSTHSGLQTVATGLQVPWAMALAPDGRLFVNERPGRILVVQNGKLLRTPWYTLGVAAVAEMGLLGIAVATDFVRSKHIYVVGTYRKGQSYVNRVIRLTDVQGKGVNPKVVIDNIPAWWRHAGDAIAFGLDGMLYIASGDARQPRLAQDRNSLAGKILRYHLD